MTAPTGIAIAPKPGKGTTRSSAGGKATVKAYLKGLPKVSNNNLGGRPGTRTKKATLPSPTMTRTESDGVPSDEDKGTAGKSSATKYEHEGETAKKSPTKKRAMKQAAKGKKEKKGKLLQDRKEEDEQLINSFVRTDREKEKKMKLRQAREEEDERSINSSVQMDGEDQFVAACALTNMLKGQERKTRSQWGEGVSASDTDADESDSVEASPTVGDLETTSPSTDDDGSTLSEPAPKKKKVKTTPDAPDAYLVVLNEDQHFTLLRQVVVANEEYTPTHPMQGRLMALANLGPNPGEDAPPLVVFVEEDPWSHVEVPEVDVENVLDHYADDECEEMPEAIEMVAEEDDTEAKRWCKVHRRIWVPSQWGEKLSFNPFDMAMPLLEELASEVDAAHMPNYLALCAWVATACCCANKGTDTSILAVKAIFPRRTPRLRAVALQMWNELQDEEKAVATQKGGQRKSGKTASLAAALHTASARRRKKPTKGQKAAHVTPPKRWKPRKMASGAGPSEPGSGGSSSSEDSSDSDSTSDSDSEDSDDSDATSDSDNSSRLTKKKKKKKKKAKRTRGRVTPPKTSSSKTEALIKAMMHENRKNLKLVLKARDDAISATGSPASKMTTARQMCLEAIAGFVDVGVKFVPPPIYAELDNLGWTKESVQHTQRRLCVGVRGSRYKSNVTVSNRMNHTLKSGDFSCGNDCSYISCRNGVTVFAVAPLTQEVARANDLDYRAYESATHRTQEDTKKQLQGSKVVAPESLREVIRYLNNYVVWLEVLAGDECSHLLEVIRLRDGLDENEERLEPVLTDHLLLTVLWRVHEDARQFFHKCEVWNRGERLPKSNLSGMVTLLDDELMIVRSITCPYDKFFDKKKDKDKEKGKGKGREKGKLGDETKKREEQATTNPTIPALCSATIKKIKAAHPNITTITEFAAQTGIPLRDLLCSSRGGCSNFTLFGVCKKDCPYNHSTAPVPEGKQKDVNTQLIQGLKILDDKKKAASA